MKIKGEEESIQMKKRDHPDSKRASEREEGIAASADDKTYTKPKKIKHKKKKVKLAVLQFYKVDDSGKVSRLRKECPNAECGAGTFMANHFDRHYCGKCGLTYVYQKA
ncbi:Ubiquitin-40S ribosomal protein S27a-1 [Acorus gramineus]|uniref:Ubiquitin-40S ribosomal protein S27a-1 n=1 Tax=Acorus gramineus TaxID=55184 RepID=A0AAV9BU48_ACOGR|nr:Ubiquitin-40S ribosomal protein S27a-1 [Acorus gramineus]